ncbi:MAG: enoyl-CoA hydratase-related protein [Leptonema sp. (in: bacteria)]
MQQNHNNSFFQVEKITDKKIAIVFLNRPEARNAMDERFWFELPGLIDDLEQDAQTKVIVIAGRGKSFSVGLDLAEFSKKYYDLLYGEAEERHKLQQLILKMQEGFRKIIQGKKIYIAAVHKHCIGGGLDLICACDLRIATKNAVVSLRESKVGIVADMGSLNRLPFIVGMGITKLMAFTGDDFSAEECYKFGLFDKLVDNENELLNQAVELASEIAKKPELVLQGIKKVLNYMENHSSIEGMDYVALWNAAYLGTNEFKEIMGSFLRKKI